jgi:hypothetical protein
MLGKPDGDAVQIKQTFYRTPVRHFPKERLSMTIAIVDQPSPLRRRTVRGKRPARGPLARPTPPAATYRGQATEHWANTVARACRVDPVTRSAASWRLTDRGIALVLILAVMIVLAAVTVIGLTAWHVTGPGYQSTGVAQLSQR